MQMTARSDYDRNSLKK